MKIKTHPALVDLAVVGIHGAVFVAGQKVWHLLFGLHQDFDQFGAQSRVVVRVEEADRGTSVADTASSADSVDVLLDLGWEIVVNDVADTLDVLFEAIERGELAGKKIDQKNAKRAMLRTRPRAATAVATRIGVWPFLKVFKASSR